MALVKCKECGAQISSKAESCPQCGAPVPKGTSTSTIVIGGFFALIVASCVFRGAGDDAGASASKAAPSPEQAQKEKDFQTVVAGAKWIKNSLKNPASFQLVSASMVSGKVLCYEYRGTNSFNAVITSHRVITDAVNSGEAKDWNKHCAGKSGTDFSHARHAL